MPISTTIVTAGSGPTMGPQLVGIGRCPHCGIANPYFVKVWSSDGRTARADGQRSWYWGCYKCTSCGSIVSAYSEKLPNEFIILDVFPISKLAHEDIPLIARTFLQQAYDTLHAPDAAAVMAGSAVDAMLKAKGFTDGSLYTRIDRALQDNVLTKGMADWAHSVRLGSNRPRHADAEKPHVSAAEAQQSVDFAEALGNFLFVLTARIERGIEAAKTAEDNT
ncbi:DUF4145 domain-containing protein [Ancylobacter sonchi]|uniref:DUF4145 domain-containing protein n=1 Tax=Ancylobacter sonchi TaxID=1937790 RepID=UPI001BD63677|nr:DUF4145 domain-containing protein [Ancylobacter sonchi]MBS7533405.1 DUF4145 domain-containing protein [Ancylobacter sonchi]